MTELALVEIAQVEPEAVLVVVAHGTVTGNGISTVVPESLGE